MAGYSRSMGNWLTNILGGAFFIIFGGIPFLSFYMVALPADNYTLSGSAQAHPGNPIMDFLTISGFILFIFLVGAGGIVNGLRQRAKDNELFSQWDWELYSVLALAIILIVSLICSLGFVLLVHGTVNIDGVGAYVLIVLLYAVLSGWLLWNRRKENGSLQEQSDNPAIVPAANNESRTPAIAANDPVLGTWYTPGKEVKADFYPDGTFDMISMDSYGKSHSYIGGKVRKDPAGYYLVHVERKGSSKQDAVMQEDRDRKFILDEKCLIDVNNTNNRFVKDFDESPAVAGTGVINGEGLDASIGNQRTVSWISMFLTIFVLALISVLLFVLMILACYLLADLGVTSISLFGVDALHLIILWIMAILAFFISGMIFTLGYYSSPFFIDMMMSRRNSMLQFQANSWAYAIYDNLKPGDPKSRIAFCFTYLLPYMAFFGGFFLVIGLAMLGLFWPLTPSSTIGVSIGFVMLIAIFLTAYVVRNRLMRRFVINGVITGVKPIPSPGEYKSGPF